ncbi:MAG: hypothetical protein LBI69_03935 [Puniceicoccales bacterium]|jgi:hypothetical protein|nr:hypothetical protein [Puniceicoccales bacterium]
MKKTIALLATAFSALMCNAGALEIPQFKLASKIGFDSEYVNHGRKEGHQNVQMSAEVGSDMFGAHAYAGARSVLFLKDDSVELGIKNNGEAGSSLALTRSISANEIAPYFGFTYDVQDAVTLDAGYVAHVYTNLKALANTKNATDSNIDTKGPDGYDIARNTSEIYLGASFDVAFMPKVYVSYDFNREEFDFNASAVYSYDLDQVGIPHFAFESSLKAGYDYAKRPFGIKEFYQTPPNTPASNKDKALTDLYTFKDNNKGYVYVKLAAGLVYRYNEQVNIYFGGSFTSNGASDNNWNNAPIGGKHKNTLAFNSNVVVSF